MREISIRIDNCTPRQVGQTARKLYAAVCDITAEIGSVAEVTGDGMYLIVRKKDPVSTDG